MRQALDEGKIVIAAGFQGIDEGFNITTLGRGGSDTTAVALAAVLHAEVCEIYTDVDGVYTTDPRLVPEARRVKQISYDEMLELASAGAGVMHNRSIEFAKKFNAPVHVRSSFSDNPGTLICAEPESPDQPVCGAALVRNEARVTLLGVPDRPGAAGAVFSRVAARNVAMDMIVQNVGANGLAEISFTVFRDDLPATLKAVEEATREIGAAGYNYDDNVSKVSVVGLGMATQSGVAEKMFRALADKGINILMITTSEIKISALVDRDHAVEALRTLHEVFRLDVEPSAAPKEPACTAASRPNNNTADIVARMQGMEDLIIEGITLDQSQARVTLVGVPDRPGLAAQVFEQVAAGGIIVDMIVQSVGREGQASLSFTVPQADLAKSLEIAGRLAKEFRCDPPTSCPRVAKLAVNGTGMRSHTGVARRLFQCLADVGINVDMISTSEMQINVLVDGSQGQKAHDALRKKFADVIV
jgi:aspartate kinase